MHSRNLRACPLCGSYKGSSFDHLGYTVVRCDQCGLVFVHEQPDISGDKLYDEGYYRGSSEHKDNLDNENVLDPERISVRLESCQAVVESVMWHHSMPGRWLDIGCGPGFLLSQAEVSGWKCTGIDTSSFATDFARNKFNLTDVHTASIEDANFTDQMFDVISMQHVIEHFFNPRDTMRRVIAWLKTGGLLYLETPDIGSQIARREGLNWEHIKLPEHVVYFSESTLRYLFEQLNCEIVFVHHPVEGTGLMNKVCGGKVQARLLYDRYLKNPIFRTAVQIIRYLNELYRFRLRGESDIIYILARRVE